MKKGHRKFKEGCPIHIYSKSKNSNIIFYSLEDYIFYFTLYSCLSRRYNICVLGFCLMPNHIHSVEISGDYKLFTLFHSSLNSSFVSGYNAEHSRKGPLFQRPFGYAPKLVAKRVRDCLSYVANNPVVGRLCDNISDYHWNLLAYYKCINPFSEKLPLRHSRYALRKANLKINAWRKADVPLDYARIKSIFHNLSSSERLQILDRIIYAYNFLDYHTASRYYKNSFDKMLNSFNLGGGSEYDLPDDFDDYSKYREMSGLLTGAGFDLRNCNFDNISAEEIHKMVRLLSRLNVRRRQIEKFLHLPVAAVME